MGFFGLFTTIIGLGAMAKDGIGNSIFEQKNKQKAVKKGDVYYSGVGSSIYSTKTGARSSIQIDELTDHEYLVDIKTGEKIEDLTNIRNKKRTEKSKVEAIKKGRIFYKTYEYDTQYKKSDDIYISDNIPGFFHKIYIQEGFDIYTKGDLVDDYMLGHEKIVNGNRITIPRKKVNSYHKKPHEWYFDDGVLYTQDELNRRINERNRKHAIEVGKKLYRKVQDSYDIMRDVETDEPYTNIYYEIPRKQYDYVKHCNLMSKHPIEMNKEEYQEFLFNACYNIATDKQREPIRHKHCYYTKAKKVLGSEWGYDGEMGNREYWVAYDNETKIDEYGNKK